MAAAPKPSRNGQPTLIRFGVFEFDTGANELRKQGVRVRLQAQPTQILLALVEQPGHIVSREELRKRLWSDDTFVDFDRSLNSAANRLRIALGDSAENPRFIETVAGTGYRFIASVNSDVGAAPTSLATVKRVWLWPAVVAAVLASTVTWFATRRPPAPPVQYRAVTFGRGLVTGAAFSGESDIVYSARWADAPLRLFLTSFRSPESRPLGFERMTLASVANTGELALFQGGLTSNITGSTLYRVPMNGGAPQKVDDHIMSAHWSPDGKSFALVRAVNGSNQVEYPPGRVLYTTAGWLTDVRLSPNGSAVAFIDHPARHDDAGDVRVWSEGRVKVLSAGWGDIDGAEWNASGSEVWFTASRSGGPSTLWAASVTSGHTRAVTHFPGAVALMDWSHQQGGRMLFAGKTRRLELAALLKDDAHERGLTWLDWSRVVGVSADGSMVLFDESGEAVGTRPVAYVYRRQTDTTVRLGEGLAQGLMPGDQAALLLDAADRRRLRLVPLAGGPDREIAPTLLKYQWVKPLPDGKRAVASATDSGGALGLWTITLDGTARPVRIAASLMVRNCAVGPDSLRVAVLAPDGRLKVFSTDGKGDPVDVPVDGRLAPLHWSRDGEWLFVQHLDTILPARVSRVRLATGDIRPWKMIAPGDPFGVNSVTGIAIAADEEHYAYSFRRAQSSLFVAEGW